MLRWLAFLAYLAVLLRFILFKHPGTWQAIVGGAGGPPLVWRLQQSNLVPFQTISYYLAGNATARVAVENVLGNILLFVPMGLLLPLVLPRVQSSRQVIALGFGASVALEILQLITGAGSPDVDDVLLNVLGTALGATAHALFPPASASAARRTRS